MGTLIPLAGLGVVAAAEVGSSSLTAEPGEGIEIAIIIIGVGVLLALLMWCFEWWLRRGARRSRYKAMVELAALGFVPAERPLQPCLPRSEETDDPPILSGWDRKGRFHLDTDGALELARLVERRWDGLRGGDAAYPVAELILVAIKPPTTFRLLSKQPDLIVTAFRPAEGGKEQEWCLPRTGAGTYDVTDLVRAA